ncbi:unnamed protein product [Acanthoscelides obtectus]|nr:unnamed protein product [Acanthoscelides obtectus]CAK1684053.1 hypothetical protein AOBTE_LOCUS34592 [Acanthoscelides obtectus]
MQISQSWEDLSLMNDNSSNSSCDWKPLNKTTPLQISLPSSYGSAFMCNSPSPTRTGFQSPTRSRTIIRRSASPVLRPSPLGVKRKLDEDRSEFCAGRPNFRHFFDLLMFTKPKYVFFHNSPFRFIGLPTSTTITNSNV